MISPCRCEMLSYNASGFSQPLALSSRQLVIHILSLVWKQSKFSPSLSLSLKDASALPTLCSFIWPRGWLLSNSSLMRFGEGGEKTTGAQMLRRLSNEGEVAWSEMKSKTRGQMMSEGWKTGIGSGEVTRNATITEKRDLIRISQTWDLNLFINLLCGSNSIWKTTSRSFNYRANISQHTLRVMRKTCSVD